ncbi:MAG: oligosaccharide flippase family protein [Peptoniphilaceae bacterium]|nr:oligosaccharide flippase family protein [Peptoniphilaceae bacterium]MDY6086354.1 oligosaccharide flippase family protein [Peptoniphilaceae bacterium]
MSRASQNSIRTFFQGTAVFMLANMTIKVAQILVLPLITAHISSADLGIADMLQGFYGFVLPLLVMGFDAAFGAFYFEEDTPAYHEKVFTTIFTHLLLTSALAAVAMLFAGPISRLIFQTDAYRDGVIVALGIVMVNLWIVPFSQRLRMEKRMTVFSLITVAGSLLLLLGNVLMVVVWQMGYMAFVLSILLSYLAQFAFFVVTVHPRLSRDAFDPDLYRRMARYALPLVPMMLVGWALSLSDRFLIQRLVGADAVGMYGIAVRFQNTLTMVTSVIFATFSSFAFSTRQEEKAAESFVFVHDVLHVLLLGLAFFASLFAKELLQFLVAPAFYPARATVAPLLFGQVCYASHTIFSFSFAFEKKSSLNLYPALLGAVVNIVLNLIFIPRYHEVAAGYTTFVGYALMMLVTYAMSQRVHPIPYHVGRTFCTSVGLLLAAAFCASWTLPARALLFVIAAVGHLLLYREAVGAILTRIKEWARPAKAS